MALPIQFKSGDVMGNFTIIKEIEPDFSGGKIIKPCRRVRVSCIFCGTIKDMRLSTVRSGRIKSCGCQQYQNMKYTHGHTRGGKSTTEYTAWTCMHNRCYVKSNPQYNDYGGRGIHICDRWNSSKGGSFENFLEDMGYKPDPSYSLDRIDVDGIYEPNNCRWADGSTQAKNKRFVPNSYGLRGIYWRKDTLKWGVEIKVSLGNGKTRKRSRSAVHLTEAISLRMSWEEEMGGYPPINYDYEQLCHDLKINHPDLPEDAYLGTPEKRTRFLALRKLHGKGKGVDLKGVYYLKDENKWRALFPMPDNTRVKLGIFETKEEAEQAVTSFTDTLTTEELLR